MKNKELIKVRVCEHYLKKSAYETYLVDEFRKMIL
jgi:hypothetical protein